MRTATRIIAASFGLLAGFGGLEHGYFEILQGNVQPQSIMIASILAGYGHDVQTRAKVPQFAPLDMGHTTFRQPLPAPLTSTQSVGYRYQNGGYHPVPKRYVRLPSTGSSHTTVIDMAHFMIAHLQDGRYATAQVLQPATSQQLNIPSFLTMWLRQLRV
jgi:hypothetical protein